MQSALALFHSAAIRGRQPAEKMMTVVTVVLVRDRKTGEIDPSAPALIYSEDGRCIEARRLRPQEIDLLAGGYCAQMRAQVTDDGTQLTGRWAH